MMDYRAAIQCADLSQTIYQDFQHIQFRDPYGAHKHLIDEQAHRYPMAILYHLTRTRHHRVSGQPENAPGLEHKLQLWQNR